MSLYVIDAAVAVKWFLPEPYSDKARTLLDAYNRGVDDLIAPDLLIPEVTNAFWKQRGFRKARLISGCATN